MENVRPTDRLFSQHAGRLLAIISLVLSGCGPGDLNPNPNRNRNCGDVTPYVDVNGDFVPSSSFSQTGGCAVEGVVDSSRDGNPDNDCYGSVADEGPMVDLSVQMNMDPGDKISVFVEVDAEVDAQVEGVCYPTSNGMPSEFLQTKGSR